MKYKITVQHIVTAKDIDEAVEVVEKLVKGYVDIINIEGVDDDE